MKKKKLLSMLLVLAMVLSLMPAVSIPAAAAGSASNTTALQNAINGGGTVTIGTNFSLTETITVSGNVTLDLNGHTLTRNQTKCPKGAFVVTGSLTVINSSSTSGGITGCGIASSNTDSSGYGSIFYVDGGTLKLNTGSAGDGQIILKNNRHNRGGGVWVNSGTLNMYEGVTIENCQAEGGGDANYGGGVYVASNSTFNMYGGTIDGCIAQYGGGVFVHKSVFNMSGGTIQNCTCARGGSERIGAALYLYDEDASSGTHKQSKLSGGFIQDNGAAASDCGGIYVHGLDLLITGTVTITGNSSDGTDHTSTMYVKKYGQVTIDGGYFGPQGGGGITMTYYDDGENIDIKSGKFSTSSKNKYEYKSGGSRTKIETGKQTCSITFNNNGGSGGPTNTPTTNYGSTMPAISVPTRAGYKFLGYYDAFGDQYYAADGTTLKPCDYVGSMTLTADWELSPCTVTLNKNGGTGGTGSVTAYNGSAMPTSGVTMPTRTGYTFAGYFDTNATSGGNQYYKADGTSARTWNKTGTTATLYARWTPNEYTVTLDPNGGFGGSDKVTATYDAAMPGVTMPSRPGYTSTGFYTSTADGTQYYTGGGSSAKIWDKTEATTLYAHWYPNTYTIQYWSQDDRAAAQDDAAFVKQVTGVTYGSFLLDSAAVLGLTREHYDFIGWNLYRDQDWAMYQAGKNYSGGLTETAGGTATIYAAWKEKPQFTVSYNANGGENAPAGSTVYRDDDYTVSTTVPTRDGYTFTGWQADGVAYAGGSTITNVQGNITLSAQWQRNNSVGYHPNGGSYAVAPSTVYPAKDATVTVDFTNKPTREGYTFLGYAETPAATSAVYTASGTNSFTMGTAGVTLYAVWEPWVYPINYSGCVGRYTFEGTQPTLATHDADYTFQLKVDAIYNTDNLSVAANGIVVQPASVVDSTSYKVFTYTVKAAKGEQSVVISGIATTPQKISYELNGGAIEGEYPTYYENGVGATLPASDKVKRTGYTFGGWFADEDFGGTAVTAVGTAENGEKTFYASWTANSYAIHYDPNGGTDAPADTAASYDAAAALADQGSMTYLGYSFLGWDENPNAVAPTYLAGDSVKNLTAVKDGTVTLYAIWNVEHHSVIFHLGGGVMQDTFALTQSVKHGGSITTPAVTALTKTGNEFMGWATTEGSAIAAYGGNASVTVNDDLDLYAIWKASSYTVTYYNGDTKVEGPVEMTFGTLAALNDGATLIAPANKEFLGWSRSSTAAAAEFVGGQQVTAIGDGSEKEISLYAVWGDKTAKYLTYNANGGLWVNGVPGSVVDYGDGSVTLEGFDTAKLSRPGYTRDGWLLGDTKYEDGATIQITANTTVYANWIANGYTVKFNANGGSGATGSNSMSYDAEAALNACGFTREGYTFKGWARSADGPLEFTDGQKVLNLTNVSGEEITLYAVWEAIEPVWITYHANGGMAAPAAESFAKDTEATVTSAAPTLDGYTFLKWNTKADGSGTDYESAATFTITENMTLYAVWEARTVYHVTYDLNGGTGLFVDPKSYFAGDTVTIRTESEPYKAGNDFAGWKLDDSTTLRAGGTTTFVVADTMDTEIVLTAEWTARKYLLSFTFGANEFVYDGGSQPVAVTASDNDGRVFTAFKVYYTGTDYAKSETAPTEVGTYTVTVEYDTNNYALNTGSTEETTLTITKKPVTVTVQNTEVTYGNDTPYTDKTMLAFSETITESKVDFTGLTYAGYAAGGNAGSHSITAAGLTSDTYSFTYVPGTLTVLAKTLTVADNFTVTAASKVYDGTDSAVVTAAAKALFGSDTLAVTVSGSFEDAAVGTDKTVSFEISSISGAKAGNYVLADDMTGTTTASITEDAITFTFGTSEFIFDGSAKNVTVSAFDGSKRVFTDYDVYYVGADTTVYAASAAAPSAAGSYKVVADYDTSRYTLTSGTSNVAVLTIAPRDVVVWASAGTEHKYDGTAKAITAMSAPNELALDVTYYAVDDAGSIGDIVDTPTDVGDYFYVITLADNDANKNYAITGALAAAPSGKADSLTASNVGIMAIRTNAQPELVVGEALVKKTFGDADFIQTVTGGAEGADITYTIISGAESIALTPDSDPYKCGISVLKPGLATVEVRAAKDGYADATARFTVSVEKKLISFELDDTIEYTGEVLTAPYTLSGVVDSQPVTAEDLVFTYQNQDAAAKDAHTFRNVGSYNVTAAISDANEYYCSNGAASKTIRITRAELTVTVDDVTITYGDAVPAFTVSYTGLGTDTGAFLGGTAEYSCAYRQFDDVGSYEITVSGLTSPDYNITFAPGELTVLQLPVTLSWSQSSFTYDGTEHSVTATVSNAVNGDPVVVKTYTGSKATVVGDYTAEATALDDANYTLTDGANLTKAWRIAKKAITIRPASVSINVNGSAELRLDVSKLLPTDWSYTGVPSFKLTDGNGNPIELAEAVKAEGNYTITWTNPDEITFNENYNVTKVTTAILTVSKSSGGGGGGGGSSSGSSGGSDDADSEPASETTTVPVDSGNNTIPLEAEITGSEAKLVIDPEELQDALYGDEQTETFTIDLSELKEEITSVVIPADALDEIAAAANDPDTLTDSMSIALTDAAVTLDAVALASIAEQAGTEDIRIAVSQSGAGSLNAKQAAAVKDTEVLATYSASLSAGGEMITIPEDGSAEVTFRHPLNADQVLDGLTVMAVAEDGSVVSVPYTVEDGEIVFTGDFSTDYVIAYAAEENSTSTGSSVCSRGDDCPICKFTDTDATLWWHDGIEFCLDNGLMKGVSETEFDPTGTTSRAMIVTILWRLAGEVDTDKTASFSDVAADEWFTDAIRWAANEGIVNGYEDGSFQPAKPVTREELAAILYRFARKMGEGFVGDSMFLLPFEDLNEISDWASEAVRWCYMKGIILGRTETTFVPKATATRAEAATMIQRFCMSLEK